jgi:hypothetical protein
MFSRRYRNRRHQSRESATLPTVQSQTVKPAETAT